MPGIELRRLEQQVAVDVSDRAQVESVAEVAVAKFGRIDTWVAVAAVVVYADFEHTTPEEFRRLMEVNFMGQVHGFQVAPPHLRRAGGGALVSVGSGETVISMPLNSAYGVPMEQTKEAATDTDGNLYEPSGDARVQGDFGKQALPFSPYTWLATHPTARRLLLAGAVGGLGTRWAARARSVA
ncbi:SDR family NAD(P)-dependent oxidoreductase [Nocardia asteroides]|uniref:SDR family NAD(P)-dependent oxidoreductase n=1 Tax=Nocardia asteroides TaxID=1824 RepID=UPI00365B18B3